MSSHYSAGNPPALIRLVSKDGRCGIGTHNDRLSSIVGWTTYPPNQERSREQLHVFLRCGCIVEVIHSGIQTMK